MSASSDSTRVTTHHQYETNGMPESAVLPTPMPLFHQWFRDAIDAGVPEPEAMTLSTTALPDAPSPAQASSTIDKAHWRVHAPRPSARTVLLKGADECGFYFYSNYASRKGDELAANPWCSLSFYWPPLHRAVRVLGRAERMSRSASQAYFDTRPLGSRVGAWASPQSQVLSSREALDACVAASERQLGMPTSEDAHVPVPEHWGGYMVVPDEVEFWVGRTNRLHDRYRYSRDPNTTLPLSDASSWTIERLAP